MVVVVIVGCGRSGRACGDRILYCISSANGIAAAFHNFVCTKGFCAKRKTTVG